MNQKIMKAWRPKAFVRLDAVERPSHVARDFGLAHG